MNTKDIEHFRTFGFVVLRAVFAPDPLRTELDAALAAGHAEPLGTGVTRFRYGPLMGAETPHSRALLDRCAPWAAALAGRPVLPARAKGQHYLGDTAWHTDSDHPILSLGCLAYLESLQAANGALRVLPGSHQPAWGAQIAQSQAMLGSEADALPGVPLPTEPGDLIVFDEHLYHASAGGGLRRQWRADFVIDPRGGPGEGVASEQAAVEAWFAQIFPPNWDGGYDVDVLPSYPAQWLADHPEVAARLRHLGVLDRAARQEAYARAQRRLRERGPTMVGPGSA